MKLNKTRIIRATIISITGFALCMGAMPQKVSEPEPKSIPSISVKAKEIQIEDKNITATSQAVQTVATVEIEPKTLYTSTVVNFRKDANLQAKIIKVLNGGCQVVVTKEKGDFSYCTVGNETGYIATKYLQEQSYTDSDLRLMSAIIWAEAGNQCTGGMQAVGIVVMNRVESDVFPNSVHDVIYQKSQFSPTMNGMYNTALSKYDAGELPDEVIAAARYALFGNKVIAYNGISYDMSSYLFFSRYRADCRLQIQDHQFA